jgi:hypothetical protein
MKRSAEAQAHRDRAEYCDEEAAKETDSRAKESWLKVKRWWLALAKQVEAKETDG